MEEDNNFYQSSSDDINERNSISNGERSHPFSLVQFNAAPQIQSGIGQPNSLPSCPVPQIPVYPPRFYYYTAAQGFPRTSFESNNFYQGYFGNEGTKIIKCSDNITLRECKFFCWDIKCTLV